MKKILTVLVIASLLLVSLSTLIAATPNGWASHLYLYEKNPSTWEVIEDGAWGKITYVEPNPFLNRFCNAVANSRFARRVPACEKKYVFNGHELVSGKDYTLLTYGGWSNIKCFGTSTSNDEGNVHLSGVFDFELMTDDLNIPVKIWLVPATSVNCELNKMMVWNPTEFLFEQN